MLNKATFEKIEISLWNLLLSSLFGLIMLLVAFDLFSTKHKTNSLFFSSFIVLVILPIFSMGFYNDLLTKSSSSFLFIIMTLVFEELQKTFTIKKMKFKVFIIIFLLAFGFLDSFYMEFWQESVLLQNPNVIVSNEWETLEKYANRNLNENNDLLYNYYSYDIESNLFYKYLAKTKLTGE